MDFTEVIEVLDRGSSIDVQSNCTFDSLMISQKTLERLKANRFDRPSPVQAKAIPLGLLGRDMLVQAKSGTGKTLVFSILAVENLDLKSSFIQKVIVTPTREIATQINETIRKVAPPTARSSVYVGGIAVNWNVQDLKTTRPHIVVGTTGRLCQLVKQESMDMSHCDFFALDEADKMMDACFKDDVNFLVNALPKMRQVAVFSATYPRNMDVLLEKLLVKPALVRFNADDVQLVGIKQYVITKCSPVLEKLAHILKSVRYVQALIFTDQVEKCEPIAAHLKSEGLDVTYVSSAMSQKERQRVVDQLRTKRVKILVSSDLTARGIDADNVNLVVNIDAAANEETYFHRIGRAARFGAHGAAVTLLDGEKALKCFTALAYRGKVTAKRATVESLPEDLPKNTEYWEKLPFFIDFDKSSKKCPNSDLEAVPDRKLAMEKLRKEREASGTSNDLKYDREKIIELRGDDAKENENFDIKAAGDGPENSPEIVKEEKSPVVEKKSFKERLAELKAARQTDKSKTIVKNKEEEEEEKKPKFKFVPTREKAKKKYYMRGELLHIRNSVTAEQWKTYAETKFDLSEQPFLAGFSDVGIKIEKKKDKKREPKPDKPKNPNLKSYTRAELCAIAKSIPKTQWLSYIKSKWDISDEPWELDTKCRYSATERFQRQRRIEKEERKKVIEERQKKKEEERRQLVPSGRTTHLVKVEGASWEEYQMRVKKDFEEKVAKRREAGGGGVQQKIGPVVPTRDPPLIYKYRVDMYKRRLQEQDLAVAQEIERENQRIRDVEVQTDCEKDEEEIKGLEGPSEKEEVEDVVEEQEDEQEQVEDTAQEEFKRQIGAGYVRNMNYQAAAQSYMDYMNLVFSKFQ
uniref:RNA helicase n=1 Tax=Caenorhabditis japonica TaxID=281687 RepID=A0A8R1HWJ6_CAEJA